MVYSDEVAMMSFDCISWEVKQICDLENDGMNCSIVITLGYFVRLLSTTANACTVVFIGGLSATEDYHGEQRQSVYCKSA